MKLLHRLSTVCFIALLLTVIRGFSLAQGWPPTSPNPDHGPYMDNLFYSNGHAYKIEFYDVCDTFVDPRDPTIMAGDAFASIFGANEDGTSYFLSPPFNSYRYDPRYDNPFGTNMGLWFGVGTDLWRVAAVSSRARADTYYAEGHAMANPVFRFKITKMDSNDALNIIVRIAEGAKDYIPYPDGPYDNRIYVYSGTDVYVDSEEVGDRGSIVDGTAHSSASYPSGVLSADVQPGERSIVRRFGSVYFEDHYVRSLDFIDGVAYLCWNTPISVDCTAGVDEPIAVLGVNAIARTKLEIIPMEVIGP